MITYYCAHCNLLHSRPLIQSEIIFTTAFHWKEDIIYQVGICNKQLIVPILNTKESNFK